MKPSKMSNEALAINIELWASVDGHLTEGQKEFFNEVVWRLRLMTNVEKEAENG